jgi:hypothetical protein
MKSKDVQHATRYRLPLKGGQAMLTAVIFFLILASTIVLGVAYPILKHIKTTNDLVKSKESYFLAAGVLEDGIYRLRNTMTIASDETYTINGHTVTLTLSTIGSGKLIDVVSDVGSLVRKMRARFVVGVGVAFTYSVQVGNGGLILSNNSGIYGNVFSNGDIVGSAGAFITGSAVAANTISLTSDQANDSPSTPPSSITFRNTTGTQDIAQSFIVSTTSAINKVRFYIRKVGSPASATIKIVNDVSGSPGTFVYDTGTLDPAQITTSFGWIDVTFANNAQLNEGEEYWVVIDSGSQSSSSYYVIGANSTYSNSQAKTGQYGSTWNTTGLDAYFSLYMGGLTSLINRVTVGQSGVGDARAHTVTNTTAAGNIYCATGSGNNKACTTTLPDAVPIAFPISDANVQQWKEEAEQGGVQTGDITIDGTAVALGPKKITGNVNIINGSTVTLNGNIWIQGNLLVDNGALIKLNSAYGQDSGTIIVDGRITIQNNANFAGTGQTGSVILLLTTSDCPDDVSCGGAYAIEVSNNAGTVVLNAQKGTIHFSNNAGAKEATARVLYLDNNASITYESGLSSINFVSGPTGGWNISLWKEVE